MKIRHLFTSTAIPPLAIALCAPLLATSAFAQVDITDERTTSVQTSTAGDGGVASDVTITATGRITVTTGTAVTLDSDNDLVNDGNIITVDADDTTGVLITGVTGNFTNNGTISLTGAAPTDGITPTSAITTGTGRTGILISGASPFVGNVTNAGSISVSGQNSTGIRLANLSSITGDIFQNGNLSVFGENSTGVDIAGNVIGNLAIGGPISAVGENSQAVNISGDVSGTATFTNTVTVSGFVEAGGNVLTTRPTLAGRDLLADTGNLRQAASAVQISGNIAGGVHFAENRDADTNALISTGSINMIGSAPAILIDGNGTPIAIGLVAQITDPNDADFDAELQYAFVNQGSLVSNGFLDDANATVFSLSDAQLLGGLNNTASMRATVYRSGIDPEGNPFTNDAHARVIVIGGGGIAERINNSGAILASGFEAVDSVFADPDNVQAPNTIFATAIEILAGGSLETISNIGRITAIVTARDGTAVAIRDASGTFIELNNSGVIEALGVSSDFTGEFTETFNLIAIDVSANTTGFTLNQTVFTDPDTDVSTVPTIVGDILLGSGSDTIDVSGGTINSNITFGDGADRLLVSGGAAVTGSIADSDGQLEILVTGGSSLTINTPDDFNITTATFDSTSTYSPFIDPQSGEASIMIASGDVTFEDGATIDPRLGSVLTNPSTSFTIVQAGTLNASATFANIRGENSPYLYNTVLTRDPLDANTLVLTLDLRSTAELGLDTAQSAAFTSAFEALQNSDALGGAFVGLTDQASFNAAYNQLLPEFSAAAVQFVMANIDGAAGAVGSHLNSARRSQEKTGGLWIEQFAYFADKDITGQSEQYRGQGFGITGGFDTAFGPFHNAGINIGFATTEVEDVLGQDEPLNVLTLQAGLYGGMEFGNLGIDLYAGGGYNDFEANRNVVIGAFNQSATADWSGYHVNASATAGYNINFGKYFVRPSASFSYLNMNESAFIEQGSADITQSIDARQVDVGTATGMVEFGAKFERDRAWFSPSIRAGFRNDFVNGGIITTGRYTYGGSDYSLLSEGIPESGILLGLTFASGSDFASFSFDYDTDIRSGFIRHTARIVLRLIF
ncbi:MAG: autotransporter domain-containing protein [Robiginitomaculum sp.]|nr:autotransporter domain-containing protein [Robiginitomaculum sp.]